MEFYPISVSCQIKNLDQIYQTYLGRKYDGIYVDVGAHDGYSWSNTWGLATLGWQGLLFEPLPELYVQCESLYSKYPKVKIVNSCIGSYEGTVKLYSKENPTIDEETVKLSPWGFKYDENNFIECSITTLTKSLVKYGIRYNFDLLSVDVEGAELHVLEGLDLELFTPKMIILETHDGNPDVQRTFHAEAIKKVMNIKPYDVVNSDGLNTIYVRRA